jgi:hypothetical protein
MKKEARLLHDRAIDALTLAIDHFNRAWNIARAEGVLIQLDRSFEMLLKAAIVHRGGRIREPRAKQTLGFDHCVRKCLTDADVKCLNPEQALTLQVINGLRDAAQHYILEISEEELYLQAQAGVTLFKDLLGKVFEEDLSDSLPERVLPIATRPLQDLQALFGEKVDEVRKLLKPGARRRVEARARIRPMAIMEGSVQGSHVQPGEDDLNRILRRIEAGEQFEEVFPGVSALRLQADGSGVAISLRITKAEGIPIKLVKEGEPGAAVVAVKRVNEIDFYSLGLKDLAAKVELSAPRTLTVIRHLKLQGDDDYFKEIRIGAAKFKRYSALALDRLKKELPTLDVDKIWREMIKAK